MTRNPPRDLPIPSSEGIADSPLEEAVLNRGEMENARNREGVEDVPELPETDPEFDAFFDLEGRKMERRWMKDGVEMSRRMRRNVVEMQKRTKADGDRYEKLAKEVAVKRNAEKAKELAEDLKEINASKREPLKKAAESILAHLKQSLDNTSPLPKLDHEAIAEKAAKNLVKEKAREDKLTAKMEKTLERYERNNPNEPSEVLKPAVLKEREPVAAREPKESEPATALSLAETLEARKKDLWARAEATDDMDERKDLVRQARVIESELKEIQATEAEGTKLEARLEEATSRLSAEEAKIDKEAFLAAEKAVEEAKLALEKASTLRKEKERAWQADEREIKQLEKNIRATRSPKEARPIELRLAALHKHALGLRDELNLARTTETETQNQLRKAETELAKHSKGVQAAKEDVTKAKEALRTWQERQGTETDPAMIAGKREFARAQKERDAESAKKIETRFGGAKGEAMDASISHLSPEELRKQTKAFENAAGIEPGNPVLAEMAKRYRNELDRRNAAAETRQEHAEKKPAQDRRDNAARDREINTLKMDYAFYMGQVAAAEDMIKSSDPETASIGAQALEDLRARKEELDTRYDEFKTYIHLDLIKPRPLTAAEETRWKEKYGAKEGQEVEAEPTPKEAKEIAKREAEEARKQLKISLEAESTASLEETLSKLHKTIAEVDVPSESDLERAEMIETILVDRVDVSDEKPDEEASRIATLSKPLTSKEQSLLSKELQTLSLEDLIERSKKDLEFFDADPTNAGFAQRAKIYNNELARRTTEEPIRDSKRKRESYQHHVESKGETVTEEEQEEQQTEDRELEEEMLGKPREENPVYKKGDEATDIKRTSTRLRAEALFPGLKDAPKTEDEPKEVPKIPRKDALAAAEALFKKAPAQPQENVDTQTNAA